MSILLKQNRFELLRVDDDDADDAASLNEPIPAFPDQVEPTQKPKRKGKTKSKRKISPAADKESTTAGDTVPLAFPSLLANSENTMDIRAPTRPSPPTATAASVPRADIEVDHSLPAGGGGITDSWAYVRDALVRFNPFYSFAVDNESPDPDLNDFQHEHQSSDASDQSERPPAYAEPGLGTSIFSTDTGLTQVYASGNSVIYTGTSPTIFAGSNATVVTTTTPQMITQAVHDSGSFSHIALPEVQDSTRHREIPPSTPAMDATRSAAITSTSSLSKTVDVKYHLRWADTEGLETVKRHLSLEELKGIEPVQRLKDNFAPNADVKVSPARSANSDTSIQVKSSYQTMLEKVRADIKEDIRLEVNKEVEGKIKSEIEGKYALLVESMALIVMRNMENYAFDKMVALLPDTDRTPFRSLVKQFRKKFTIQEWSNDDYNLLANSPTRTDSNQVAHLDMNAPRAKQLKSALWEYLARNGEPGELQRYQNFYKFATGEYVAIRK